MNKYIISIDFDGTIHDHSKHSWTCEGDIKGPIIKGSKEAINELSKRYKVVIVSSRCNTEKGKQAIIKWLDSHGINVFDVSSKRPPSLFTIDDRAIKFDGIWEDTLKDIENFKVWYK